MPRRKRKSSVAWRRNQQKKLMRKNAPRKANRFTGDLKWFDTVSRVNELYLDRSIGVNQSKYYSELFISKESLLAERSRLLDFKVGHQRQVAQAKWNKILNNGRHRCDAFEGHPNKRLYDLYSQKHDPPKWLDLDKMDSIFLRNFRDSFAICIYY